MMKLDQSVRGYSVLLTKSRNASLCLYFLKCVNIPGIWFFASTLSLKGALLLRVFVFMLTRAKASLCFKYNFAMAVRLEKLIGIDTKGY